MNKGRKNGEQISDTADRSVQNTAMIAVAIIIAALFFITAAQSGLFSRAGCAEAPVPSAGDAPVSLSDAPPVSDADTSGSDAPVSGGDVTSPTDAIVVYYPEVHIEGITLPEEYGAGLFDPEAAMWLINEYRAQNGLYPLLSADFGLRQVTRIRLEESIGLFSHQRPDGTSFTTAYDQTGLFYRSCAENLALGQYTAEEVVRDWIESDTHRANLLSTEVIRMCVMTAPAEDGRQAWVFEAYSPQ